jgi:hypothetical protein
LAGQALVVWGWVMEDDIPLKSEDAPARFVRCLVGTQTGLVKAVNVGDDSGSGSVINGKPTADGQIVSLTPGRTGELVVAQREGGVRVLRNEGAEVVLSVTGFAGPVAGASLVEGAADQLSLACVTEAGTFHVIDLTARSTTLLNLASQNAGVRSFVVGKPVERLAVAPGCSRVVAVGGKDNRLALWDVWQQKRLFQARNPPDDWLGMSVPTWVSGIAFARAKKTSILEDGSVDATLAVISRYHELQLYETQEGSQRAKKKLPLGEDPLTCVCWTNGDERLVVGNAVGVVWVINVAEWKVEGRMSPSCLGSVRDLVAFSASLSGGVADYVMAAGLDRFLYCFRLGKRTLFKKVYMKQKMCRLVVMAQPSEAALDTELVTVKREESDDDDADWAALPDVGPKKRAQGISIKSLSSCSVAMQLDLTFCIQNTLRMMLVKVCALRGRARSPSSSDARKAPRMSETRCIRPPPGFPDCSS